MFQSPAIIASTILAILGLISAVLLIMQPELLRRQSIRVSLIGFLLVLTVFVYWLGMEHDLLLQKHSMAQREINRFQQDATKLKTSSVTAMMTNADGSPVGIVP